MADTATSATKPVSKLATAADLSTKLDSLRKARWPLEKDWRLNLAFYKGNQYAQWNPHVNRGRGGITVLPTEDGEKPRYRVRMVSNQIVMGVQSLISKLIKTKPIWSATPATPGDKAVKAAECAEFLLESWWSSLRLNAKYQEALIWAQLGANGYWVLCWDKFAAKAMKYLVNPQGEPITDDAIESEFRAQLQQAGIDEAQFERVTYMGDVKVEVVSPLDVFGDNTAKSADEWEWCFVRYYLPPDKIAARWPQKGKDVKPDAVPMAPDKTFFGGEGAGDVSVKAVWCHYVLPNPTMPKGREVWFLEDPDVILEDKPWQYPVRQLPVVQFQGIRVPGSSDNEAIVTHVRPLQKQLNRLLSQVVEYTNMVIKPRVWAPVNSLRQRLTTEPGAVYEYTPVGNLRPEIEQLPSLPPYVFEFLGDIGARIREMFGLTEVTEGQLPPNLEAADAIDLLQEMATDRFAPTIQMNEEALGKAGSFLLALAQAYYDEPRLMQINGLGGATSVKEFSKTDIGGEMTIRVEAGSSMPRSRAARRQQIEKWVEMGLVTPQRAWKYYDIADVKDIALRFQLDEDHALREHEKMIEGVPLNPEAMQQAIQTLQQGINPETGQPLGPNDNPQMLVQNAALRPYLAEDLTVHLEKHGDYIKSMEFDSLQPEIRQRFLSHYEITLTTWRNLPAVVAPKDAPRISVQLRESVGPSTLASVLHRAGVPEVDAQTLGTEQPMETMVMENLNQPVVDSAPGQDAVHLTQAAQTMLAAEAANADAQQSNAHKQEAHDQKMNQAETSHVQQAQQVDHAEQLHQQKMRHAEEMHRARIKAANKPAAKPNQRPKGRG